MVAVTPITPDTAAIYRDVRLRALRDSPTAFGSTFAKESLLTDEEWRNRAAKWTSERAAGFLAMDGENALGIVAGFLDEQDESRADLVSMWVAPEARRRGVGGLLVTTVLDWAASRRARVVILAVTSNNDAAIRFYGRIGFAKNGRVLPYPNDRELF